MHCPEAAQPTVTFLGTILERGGQLNDGPVLLHYRLQTTVYDNSIRAPQTFPITAYFKNGSRWLNFPVLIPQTQIFITGRIFGVTKENQQLAVLTEDIHFLPTPLSAIPPSPSSTGKRKRPDRWATRASPSTPSKSTRLQNTTSMPNFQDESQETPSGSSMPNNTDTVTLEEEDDTLLTWPDTEPETEPTHPEDSPSERRSQRRRKTSYVDILSQFN